tara:strand:+ start:589 stop:1485 length:897 start_codon:yes stop_codon:yes gene_type:complete
MSDENVKEQEQVELELPEQEPDDAVVVEETSTEEGSDNFEKAESATQKRIDRLTKRMREAERDKDEAIRYAQQVQNENTQFKQRIQNMDHNYVSEFSNRVESQIGSAEAELARAVELGDSAQVVEAQKKLTQLAIENDRAQQAKVQQERLAQQQAAYRQQAAYQQQQQPPQAQQTYKEPDPKAQRWAERNDWFGSDEAMTYAAFGIHKKLVEDEGFDPTSDEYYSELDSRMMEEFPHKLDSAQNDKRGSKRSAQNVASVSRSTGGRSKGKKVRLTPSQISIAKKLGVPLEEYAKYVKE